MDKSYIKSLITSYVRTFLQIAIAIFLTPFILSHISKTEFGSYSLAQSTILLLGLINFGFGGALNVFASRNTKNLDLVSKYASITATFQLCLGIIGLVSGIILSFSFTQLFNINNDSVKNINIVIILFSFGYFFTMLSQTYTSLLTAYRQIHIDNLIGIGTNLINSFCIIVFLNLDFGILGMAITVLITQFLSLLIVYFRVKKALQNINILYFKLDWIGIKEMFNLGIWFFVGSVSVLVIEKFDQILTARIINIETVTIFVISSKLFELARTLIYSISNNLRPYLGKMIGEGENEKAYQYFVQLRRLSIFISVFVSSILIYTNKTFVSLWVGSDFYGGELLTIALGLNLIYYCWKLPIRAFLTANLIVKEQSIYGVFEGFLNIMTSYFLGLKFGLIGIVLGTFITGYVFQFITYAIILNKSKLETLRKYFLNTGKILFQSTFIIMISIFVSKYFPLESHSLVTMSIKIFLFTIIILLIIIAINFETIKMFYIQRQKK